MPSAQPPQTAMALTESNAGGPADDFDFDIDLNLYFRGLMPSPTLAVNERVAELRREGRTVYHLGFGESRFPVHPRLAPGCGAGARSRRRTTPAGGNDRDCQRNLVCRGIAGAARCGHRLRGRRRRRIPGRSSDAHERTAASSLPRLYRGVRRLHYFPGERGLLMRPTCPAPGRASSKAAHRESRGNAGQDKT